MSTRTIIAIVVLLMGTSLSPKASGRVGLSGLVEKVVFEPSEQAPERLQVWGAFAYADPRLGDQVTPVRKGYVYFRIPDKAGATPRTTVLAEWKDLKAVAGTGQVVGFGSYGYIGGFQSIDPGRPSSLLEMYPGHGDSTDLRVRPAAEAPASPSAYMSDAGVVRIPDTGSRADLVRRLKATLAAK